MTSAGWGELEKRVKIWNNTTWQSLKKECACVLSRYSCVWLFVTLWIVVHQAPLFMGFSRQKYFSGLPFPPPRDLPNWGLNLPLLRLLHCRQILYCWATREAPKEGDLAINQPRESEKVIEACNHLISFWGHEVEQQQSLWKKNKFQK